MPTLVRQQRARRASCLPAVDGNFERRFRDHSRQVDESLELDILLPIARTFERQRFVASPVHDRREGPAGGIQRLPFREYDWLPCRQPLDTRIGHRLGHGLAEAELNIVHFYQAPEIGLPLG
jgi:hypothetical protein